MFNRHGKVNFWLLAFLVLIALSIVSWYANKDFWISAWGNVSGIGTKIKYTVSPPTELPPVSMPKPYRRPTPAAAQPPAAAPQPAPVATVIAPSPTKNNISPVDILRACIDKLKAGDIIGAEEFVSPSGLKFTSGATVGVHKVMRKGLVELHNFDEIGYKDAKVNGQTAWIPIYTNLGPRKKMISVYIIMANRGDGWKLDDIFDPKQF